MKTEKAYKILAAQENISARAAKELIDAGLVSHGGKRLEIARGMMPANSVLKLHRPEPRVIFEDEQVLALDKPIGIDCSLIKSEFRLLNRLDRDTSGVVLFAKTPEFAERAIAEYAAQRVQKLYLAVVRGIFSEGWDMDEPLVAVKGASARVRQGRGQGAKEAFTRALPLAVSGKKTLLAVQITTGRTHQIRVHLNEAGAGILGDVKYSRIPARRLMLHCARTALLGYDFRAGVPDFGAEWELGGLELGWLI